MNVLNLNKKQFLALTAILILCIVLLRYLDQFLVNTITTKGIVSFELAEEFTISKQILNSWNMIAKTKAIYSLYIDFIFLIVYSYFIAVLIQKTTFIYKKVFIVLIFIAAILDILENISLLKLIYGSSNAIWSKVAFYFASLKFVLILICICYLLINGIYFIYKKLK